MFTLHCLAKLGRERLQSNDPSLQVLDRECVESADTAPAMVGHVGSPYSAPDLAAFPVLKRRNVWCIQRHLATAPHYDLRLRLRNGLFSWAIPKGLMDLSPSETRLAIETTLHPLSYVTFEGGNPGVHDRGTLLWDIGFYTIDELHDDPDSQEDDSDPDGAFEEEKLDLALNRISAGRKRSFVVTLRGGQKLTNSSFMLIYQPGHDQYKHSGEPIKEWLLRLPSDTVGPTWDSSGENGKLGCSVKTGRTMAKVCRD